MKLIGIIPARYQSSRFPGKPLVNIHGKSMIQRVYEQAQKCTLLQKIVVATDDERIYEHVINFGGQAIMTRSNHHTGTERCAEAAEKYNFDAVINIQGDEPYINPQQIEQVALLLKSGASIATLIKKITRQEELFNTHIPKVVINTNAEAIYFSRQTIPHIRNHQPEEWLNYHTFYKHIGIYGYQTGTLKEIVQLPPSKNEQAEQLEQLRWIDNGYTIKTGITRIETVSVDTPEDLQKILNRKNP